MHIRLRLIDTFGLTCPTIEAVDPKQNMNTTLLIGGVVCLELNLTLVLTNHLQYLCFMVGTS